MNLTGVVLSGGKSSRMGSDKGLIIYKGKPLIEHSIQLLLNFTQTILISTSNREYEIFGYPIVHDLIQEIGPIGGLYSTLKEIKTNYALYIACDMPEASIQIAQLLISVHTNADCIVPIINDKIHPLFGLYSRRIISIIENQINLKNYKLKDLLSVCNTKYIEIDTTTKNLNAFKNINTPKDAKR